MDGRPARCSPPQAGSTSPAAEFAPFDRVDAWVDDRFFWEPIAVALVALLLVLVIAGRHERRQLEA